MLFFYDISVEESNAADLVVHQGPAVSPPNDCVGAKQFYIPHFKMITTESCQDRELLS